MNNIDLGKIGEDMASRVLVESGYILVTRNYRCKQGEIDVIASKNGEISFIEVKTRRGYDYGRPCESVDKNKRRRIRNAAINYLRENREISYRKINFDVVEIVINHMKNVF